MKRILTVCILLLFCIKQTSAQKNFIDWVSDPNHKATASEMADIVNALNLKKIIEGKPYRLSTGIVYQVHKPDLYLYQILRCYQHIDGTTDSSNLWTKVQSSKDSTIAGVQVLTYLNYPMIEKASGNPRWNDKRKDSDIKTEVVKTTTPVVKKDSTTIPPPKFEVSESKSAELAKADNQGYKKAQLIPDTDVSSSKVATSSRPLPPKEDRKKDVAKVNKPMPRPDDEVIHDTTTVVNNNYFITKSKERRHRSRDRDYDPYYDNNGFTTPVGLTNEAYYGQGYSYYGRTRPRVSLDISLFLGNGSNGYGYYGRGVSLALSVSTGNTYGYGSYGTVNPRLGVYRYRGY